MYDIRGDRDGPEKIGSQAVGNENGRRAVSAADDADGGSFLQGEHAGHQRKGERAVHAKLRRGTEKHALGVRDQGREVGHAADAKEDQRRIDAEFDALIQPVKKARLCVGLQARKRQVRKQHAEGNGQKKQRLILFGDRKVDQKACDADHHGLLPRQCGKTGSGPEFRKRECYCHESKSPFKNCSGTYSITARRSPLLTIAPWVVFTCATLPSQGQRSSFSIFMASRMKRRSPLLTT